jgi:5-formyltetrahydrofolate cyclo-ligase
MDADALAKRKRAIRRESLLKRDALPASERQRLGEVIAVHLLAFPPILRSKRILLYHAVRSEVSTQPLIEALAESGKRLYLPHIAPEATDFTPAEYALGDPLAVGPFNVSQPHNLVPLALETLDAILVPGVAFDRYGGRLGYGKGFYDRFFARTRTSAVVIGIAFEIQVVERIPVEPHDHPLDALITERGVLRFKARPSKA